MNKKNILRCMALAMTFALSFSLTACFGDSTGTSGGSGGTGESTGGGTGGEEITSSLPDYDKLKDDLRVDITGWVAPLNMDEQAVQYMVDAGVNTMFFASAGMYSFDAQSPSEDNLRVADLLHKNGIKVYLHSSRNSGEYLRNIEKFKDNPGVTGFFTDEPSKKHIDELSAFVDEYNTLSGGKPYYVNLFPSFAQSVTNDYSDYESYLRHFCEAILSKTTSEEKVLSADRYPLTYNSKGQKCLDPGWLTDIGEVAYVAKEYGYKTNFFIQTMSYTSNGRPTAGQVQSRDRVPTYEDIRLQEYALMAFGYDSISMFCYATPAMGAGEFIESNVALIDRDGTRSPIYYDAQKANKEIMGFDHVILQFDWKGSFGSEKDELTTDKPRKSFTNLNHRISVKETGCLESVLSSENALYGYFMDENENDGFMVVNYNDTSLELTNKVEMSFKESYGYKHARVYRAGLPTEVEIKDNKLVLDLDIGEGVFVIPYA